MLVERMPHLQAADSECPVYRTVPDGACLPLERPGEAPTLLGHDLAKAALQLT